jgi:hypothetical protein
MSCLVPHASIRRIALIVPGILILHLSNSCGGDSSIPANQIIHPNIVIFIGDDIGWNDIGIKMPLIGQESYTSITDSMRNLLDEWIRDTRDTIHEYPKPDWFDRRDGREIEHPE